MEVLGRGAQAAVYLATTRDDLQRRVALKVFASSSRRSYAQELESWRALERVRDNDPDRRLVEGFGAGLLEDGGAYLVMAYHEQGTLADRLRREGPLPEALALAFAGQAAEALVMLHRAGLIHRDLKPSNLLLTRPDTVCLADFGLSKSSDQALSVAGTPGYCAPELYVDRPVADKEAVDVYSLGATLHALLTGQPPRPGTPDLFLLGRAGVSRPTQKLLLAALKADPSDRCALKSFLDGRLPAAGPASQKRRWTPVTLAAPVAGVLLITLGGYYFAGYGEFPVPPAVDRDGVAQVGPPTPPEEQPAPVDGHTEEERGQAPPGEGEYLAARQLEFGQGVPINVAGALRLYHESAQLGYTRAMVDLGLMHLWGQNFTRDPQQARSWFERAAKLGDAAAMCNLGVMYDHGEGVSEDPVVACEWFKQAAQSGNTRAMINLSVMLSQGRGTPIDLAESARWMKRAAEAGEVTAMTDWAVKLQHGLGVAPDPVAAEAWYRKAIAAGSTDAQELLQRLLGSRQED